MRWGRVCKEEEGIWGEMEDGWRGKMDKRKGKKRACVRKGKVFFFHAEDGIRDFCLSRVLGDVYKRQHTHTHTHTHAHAHTHTHTHTHLSFIHL